MNCKELYKKFPEKNWDLYGLLISIPFLVVIYEEYEDYIKCICVQREDDEDMCLILEKPINWYLFSKCPDIPISMYISNMYENWCHDEMSNKFTIQEIMNNLTTRHGLVVNVPWVWQCISARKDLTLDVVKSNLDSIPWEWCNLSTYLNITIEDVINNPDLPWKYDCLSLNLNITLEDFLKNPSVPLFYCELPFRDDMPIDTIMSKIPESNIPWYTMSEHSQLNYNFVINNANHDWNWGSVALALSYCEKHTEEEWNELFRNDNLYDFLMKRKIKLNWDGISQNPSITFDIIQKNPDLPWNWKMISCNKSITTDDIENNPDKPWDWTKICKYNKYITIDFIERNMDKIDFSLLSYNTFLG